MCKEFQGGECSKFKENEAPEGFISVAEDFCKIVEDLNHVQKFETMMTELRLTGRIGKRTVNYLGERITSGEALRNLLRKWHSQFMKAIDIMILKKVSEAVKSSSESRIGIRETVYNFTGTEVAEEVMKGLNLGSNYVVHTKMSEAEARKKLNEELLLYLRKNRRFIEKKNEILEMDVLSWLEKL